MAGAGLVAADLIGGAAHFLPEGLNLGQTMMDLTEKSGGPGWYHD